MKNKNNTLPLVSILIISFNRFQDLKETINKCKEIDYDNLEIVVVDGGSTDGTKDFLKNYKDKKIQFHILNKDYGSAYSHTYAMKIAKGKYLITLDDDCYLAPKVVSNTVNIFEKYDNLASIGYGLINPKNKINYKSLQELKNFNLKNYDINNSHEIKNYASAQAFRTSVLKEINYMDLNWSWSTRTEDLELNYKIIAHGYNSILIPELMAFHKVSPSNRNIDMLSINGINGLFWIILKFYPYDKMIYEYFRLILLCIYFSFINFNLSYLRAYFKSISNSHIFIKNNKRIDRKIFSKLKLPINWFFSMSEKVKSFGN